MKKLSNQNIQQAINTLHFYNEQKSLETECIICLDKCGDHIINPCGHKLCGTCTLALDKYHITQCPMCRSRFTTINAIDQPKQEATTTIQVIPQSTKIDKLFEIINDTVVSKGQKIVIVSQWVTMLNKVSESIKSHFKEKTLILSGEYSIKERHAIVKKFQTNDAYKIILVSLNSSAEGITLTSAQTMVHLDLWWNKAKEEQVTDRIHRIGQKNKVDIIHLRIKDTIEQPISKLVQKKKKISENVLSSETVEKIRLKDDSWINDIIKLITRTPTN
jgi:SNF2 family DNA or RNA helicase